MINAGREKISSIPDELLKINGVTEVYSVAGEFDLMATVRVKQPEELANIVSHQQFAKVKEITRTQTLIAFQMLQQL